MLAKVPIEPVETYTSVNGNTWIVVTPFKKLCEGKIYNYLKKYYNKLKIAKKKAFTRIEKALKRKKKNQ
jgi:hypothetical protein